MEENYDLETYDRFLGEFKEVGNHWDKIEKRTATLFQVLIDGDLKELVFVLKHYPKYVQIVCDHFRYLYNYSEQDADIYAASKLLYMSEGYHPKQFVRNLVRKLKKIDEYDISRLKAFLDEIVINQKNIHPIILGFYKVEIKKNMINNNYHKLQMKVIEKNLDKLLVDSDFDFAASDRDANLDIPYMD
ncbi:hypothetical protein [Halarcobacter anaerophilus]|jgi:hypothetical protein|uniref:hypothetical protein n=1 Tax=Halarcobacter anaerophilus TaxID=877500 RepID=UPI0005CA61E5|nr:hypothetical protein [Halarcobacter anaerophilus]